MNKRKVNVKVNKKGRLTPSCVEREDEERMKVKGDLKVKVEERE